MTNKDDTERFLIIKVTDDQVCQYRWNTIKSQRNFQVPAKTFHK